ncbi:hypothetical protein MycrhDRAFT_4248 [Mycolicibacterium rhodesiae JS60]|nr:hypothetical protein MycrhDRAFT_4248 [Mycolicibacterium rhodesiae JS60]
MAVDWATVATSIVTAGTVSALVGGAVSWFTARHVAGRQERGRSVVEARRRVRELVDPVLTRVRQYQARALASMGRDEEQGLHADDVGLCARVINASADLPWWRRQLVMRRLRELFGRNTVELCGIHGREAENPQFIVSLLIQRQAMGLLHPEHQLPQPDRGFFDQALRCAPTSPEVSQLIRSLGRLSRAH